MILCVIWQHNLNLTEKFIKPNILPQTMATIENSIRTGIRPGLVRTIRAITKVIVHSSVSDQLAGLQTSKLVAGGPLIGGRVFESNSSKIFSKLYSH